MNEEQWRTCTDSDQMLEYLLQNGKASERKRQLFTVTSYRRLWHLFTDERRRAVEVSERHADGLASRQDVDAAWDAAEAAIGGGQAHIYFALSPPGDVEAKCHLLRCIFGNPFRPLTIAPAILAWNNATVVRLAQAAYDERLLPEGTLDNGRLAILADALEEAGCTDADILGHCRSGGEHVRGCWVIDLLLGKE
jgi:hypothetical protein